ncbi:MAG: hypothetical protein QOK35_2518, partial [Pseudonocardiales bacterium]|nr:hypothetical protein [Pseudonocardiales bacterium]
APEKRIGDRERREVDDRLRQAHADGVLTLTEYDERCAQCWAARTRSELEALTHDLPDPVPPAPAPAPNLAPVPVRSTVPQRRHGPRRAVIGAAVLGVALFGAAQVATAHDASAVFGHRVVQLAPDQDRVEVGVLFGNVEVVVPDDARVGTGGTILFGSTDCDAACSGTGTRAVTVDASGGFGSVDVVRQSERATRGDDRRDRDDDNDS